MDTPRVSSSCSPRSRGAASFISHWVFLRLLGAVSLIAVLSLWTQIIGLVGRQGILPVEPFLRAVRAQVGWERFWLAPTLCWLGAQDAWLHGLCAVGTACCG